MARFTARIELHDATEDDYAKLHEFMKAQGFLRTISTEDGGEYRLPTAEYNFEGSVDVIDVLERAKGAARGTGREFEVLVTESIRRSWHNLKSAR